LIIVPPKNEVGVNAEKGLAKSHENRNVEKRVRGKMMKLETVIK
jgi:hypothetical protein